MKTFSRTGVFLSGLLSLLLTQCSLPVSRDFPLEADRNLEFTLVAGNPAAYAGRGVMWGGIVEKVGTTPEGAEIRIIQSRLKADRSPDPETTQGEFIAIAEETKMAKILKKGERITVHGDIVGERVEDGKVEKARCPVILLRQVHLWEREKRWWEPQPGSGWFWELFGASPSPSLTTEGTPGKGHRVW